MTPRTRLARLLAFALIVLGCGPAAAQGYRLGVSDVVRVKVVEWLAADGLFRDWSEVTGEYAVGADGFVAFPLLGEIPGQGKSTAELAADIAGGLREVLALQGAPGVTVEIATYAPIYVAGDVKTPGAYPFTPGLNVIKALSLAGGEQLGGGVLSTEREYLTAEGNYAVMREEQRRQLATRARLDAEIAKQGQLTMPPELAEMEGSDALIAFEQAILVANQRKATAQQSALEELVTLLNRELETLEQKKVTVHRQLDVATADLANIKSLADDGLAVNSRVSALEQTVASLESSLLDIDTAMLRARQDISDAARDRSNLEDSRYAELTIARQQADAAIAELALRMATQQALIGDIGGSETGAGAALGYLYTIVRGDEEIAADATTAVAPGDVVKVTLQSAGPSAL